MSALKPPVAGDAGLEVATHAGRATPEPKTDVPDKLVYMVNQIGKFFAHKNDEDAISGIAEHIESFWEKRMKAAIFRHLDAGAAGLEARAKQALLRLHGQRHTVE
jgi:formate dehydrogenase subunit delta